MARKTREIMRAKTHVCPHIHYIRDTYHEAYRVWNSRNPGDMFDMIPLEEFERCLLGFARRHPQVFVEGPPEQDDGQVVCGICLAEPPP